jgi:hypothetical protein
MISTSKEQLSQSPRFGKPPMGGGWMFLFAAPLLGMGIYNYLLSHGYVEKGVERTKYEETLAGVDSLAFISIGLIVLTLGVWRTMKWLRLRGLQKQYPNTPWEYDYPWVRTHSESGSMQKAWKWFGFFLLLGIIFIPLNYSAAKNGKSPVFVLLAINAIWCIFLGLAIYHVLHALKYGTTAFHFDTFPYYLGDKVTGKLIFPKPIGDYKTFTVTLQCVQEETVRVRTSKGSKSVVRCFQLYKEELKLNENGQVLDNQVPINVTLPDRDLDNSMVYSYFRYWELTVHADTPGVDFNATYLLPVYRKA